MAVSRLSGGLTPADGSDPRTFPSIWNDAADVIDANEASVASLGTSVASLGSAVARIDSEVIAFAIALGG